MDKPAISPARISQAEAVRLYDRLAPVYDAWARLTESRARSRVLELADIRDGQDVLEVAAGTGLAFTEVVRRNPGGTNFAIDISPGMLVRARRRLARLGLENHRIETGSGLAIPARPESVDTVLNNYMFDLLDEGTWPVILGEFRRVLRPGGRLVLANMTVSERFGGGVFERLYRLSPALMGGCRGVRLSGPLAENGFTVRTREYIQQFGFPSEVLLAVRT
ncbi:MAG: methyltransferase domain-containing protein [Xanthomonadales bacterium]|nr:methyltransferase domain-containing protein [Xanthomonadales bacterium]NIX13053.1 methyltransferase domain-containing protein [Xanthomonadales bacterium]